LARRALWLLLSLTALQVMLYNLPSVALISSSETQPIYAAAKVHDLLRLN
jgi:hypothetical protein